MRRPILCASLLLALSLTPVYAQRGGVHSGRGGVVAGRFGGGHGFGGHGFGGMHSGWGGGTRFSGGFGGGQFHRGGFHHCWGCRRRFGSPWFVGYGYGYPYMGYYDPYWWWDSSSSYDDDQEREREIANQENALSLQEQNLREREEWERNREERDSYARRPQAQPAKPDPATVLVFRDQHRQEISNYAIAGSTLWVLNEQVAKKIPLADLDLEATAKANDERGIEFNVPR